MRGETSGELRQDVVLGVGFLVLGVAALRRLRASAGQRGSETVITTFYSLIVATSVTRTIWFLVPTWVFQPAYAPQPEYAFKGDWLGTYVSEMLLFLGSLSLFSVFILIAIYWADLLMKIFKDSVRPSRPMASFKTVAACLVAAQGLNSCLFLARVYSSQGMILFDSALLTMLSLVCSVEISRFSHRFRTVLRTLGAINQVSTEAQVTRIVRITVAGNVFFLVRGVCELTVGLALYRYYKRHKSFDIVFASGMWDWYVLIKHASEWLILFLMLWILHSPHPPSAEEENPSDYRAVNQTGATQDNSLRDGGVAVRGGGGAGGSGGEEAYWKDPAINSGYGDDPADRQPLTANGRRMDEYGSV